MSVNSTSSLDRSTTLSPFVRAGVDGGCMICLRSIADHVDARGNWLGCKGTRSDIPLILIPDRRLMASLGQTAGRTTPAPFARRADDHTTHTATKPAPKAPTTRQEPATPPKAAHKAVWARTIPTGPQVAYVAKYAVTHKAIANLPTHDRKVYGLVARARTKGATRPQLLDALDARKHTGRVDGAIRRLRLKKVITVQAIEGGR